MEYINDDFSKNFINFDKNQISENPENSLKNIKNIILKYDKSETY